MSFRNWLLTGTSLTLMAFAPLGAAQAQDATDPALVAAYKAFANEQSEANQTALTEACIAAGFASLDECIAAMSGVAPVEEAAPPPAAEPVAEEPAPSEPAAEEAPAPAAEEAPAPSSEPMAPPPEPVAEEPVTEEPVAEQPAPSEEVAPAPASEEAASEEPMAEEPMAEEPVAEEPVAEEPVAEQPASSEEAAPATSSEEPAAPASALVQLTAAVDLYNEGVAELDAGNAGGQAKIDQAQAQIDTICQAGGFADTASCLAQFGLELNPLPPMAETPATSEEPAMSEEPVGGDEMVTDEATEMLPEDIAPEDAAPILDSQKDATPAEDAPADEQPSEEPAQEEALPPPSDDNAAQQDLQAPPPDVQSALTGDGEALGDFDFGFADEEQPDGGFVIPAEEDDENVEVVQAPTAQNPNFVFKIGIHIYITNVQRERDRFYDVDRDEIYYERLSNGRIRETIERPDGTRIVTVYNRYGDVLKRTKIYPDNREFYLATYDPSGDDDGFFIDPGDELPPLRLTISARDYILDADRADEAEVEFFLGQPPVENVRRIYSIDEVKRSARIRDSVRRLEVGNLTFDSGKATISRDQVGSLSKVANAMLALLDKNPGEVFLIEGHTDATGADLTNLVLSDERASTVARILTDFYDVPPENLTTQGYGERYLKVKTEAAEKLNRRVTVKRITPLVSYNTASN